MSEGGGGFLSAENAVDVVRGTSRTLSLTVSDSHGDAVDLTGSRVVFTVKCRASEVDPEIFKDSANGALEVAITGPTLGQAEVYIQPADTHNLTVGKYVFDVWVILVSGERHLVVGPGEFNVKQGVTLIPLS